MTSDKKRKAQKAKALPENGSPSAEDERAFKEIVGAVELRGVHLFKTSASFYPDRFREDDDATWELKNQQPEFRGEFNSKQSILYAGIRFGLTIEDNAEDPLVEVLAEYALFYKLPEGFNCSEGGTKLFAGRNGIFNSWPFFREHACSTVSKMGLPPVIIPLFRLPPVAPE